MNQDQLDNLVRLLKLIGGKFVIVEDGEPKLVLMNYDEFQEMAAPFYAAELSEKLASAELVNKEITRAQAEDLNGDLMEEVIAGDEDEIRIEPLENFPP